MITPNVIKGDNVAGVLSSALAAGEGLLRLTPTWVPRSFLHPGTPTQAASRRSVRLRCGAGRHRRALVRQHDRSGERGPSLARRAEFRQLRGTDTSR